jgi:hypothetical protein
MDAVLFSGSRRDLTIGKPEACRNKTGGAELRLLLRPRIACSCGRVY